MWAQHLRNKSLNVVEFNAWENDFSENPLICLSSELLEDIRSLDPTKNGILESVEKIENKVNEISLNEKFFGMLRIVSSIHPTFKQIVDEFTKSAESPIKKELEVYNQTKKLLLNLKLV